MPSFTRFQWLGAAGAFAAALLMFAAAVVPERDALAADTAAPAPGKPVSYLKEVRPILAQHCFQCHGPDGAARKGKLRLDLKDAAFAARDGKHIIAPGHLGGSLLWERITARDAADRMPPPDAAKPLTNKQIATLKAWIEQGAKWEDHWSLLAPVKPPLPKLGHREWVRDPLDAFVLARLEREGLRPEPEAGREAWLRRVSFDLTGLPPTPAEIDEFLKDKSADAYRKQADRLLKSPRYGERQAQEWLDLARYADTSGYQNDQPRKIWKWREWVVNAYNANMPFDQFTIEQLAGDLLPNPTLAQRIATGFNRNHPTNSEAGEEEDEYRSVYVIDRVNTTATVFMGLTMACTQCHDHKYDPISQRDYYSFYSFFNNIKERDAEFLSPRPVIPVPNPDQEPRLADLKARIAALKQRLERDDALADAAQKEWERQALARLGKPTAWTTLRPSAMLSRNGAQLKMLDDGSVLSTGPVPVQDTYDVMLPAGKKHIAALRLEVLPDDSQPEKALGRASDGLFSVSGIEIRHAALSDSQDPPPVYLSRAEADINQKPKEDPGVFDMFPGAVDSAVVVESQGPGGGFGFGGSWCIVGGERRKRHEAILLPLEPLDTNDASVIRISLHQQGRKFKSLIGRFRISYTEDDRVRELLMPAQTKLWSMVGPFPAEDAGKAFTTAFEPEKDIKHEPIDLKKNYTKVVPPPPAPEAKGPAAAGPPAKTGDAAKPPEGKGDPAKPEKIAKPARESAKPRKDEAAKAPGKDEAKVDDKPKADAKPAADAAKAKPKPEKITWSEQRWRDGTPARLQGGNSAFYLTRKITSTQARTATVQIDGPTGFKMWLNGEPVHVSAPPPPPPAPPKKDEPKKDVKPGDEEEPAGPDPDAIDLDVLLGRARSKTEQKFRIGLRQGENEIVVKVVFAGGGQPGRPGPFFAGGMGNPGMQGVFNFNITAEGDDVLNHEVATALRIDAQERARIAALAIIGGVRPLAVSSPAKPLAALGKVDAKPAAKDEPKKVSLVGEKTAAPKPEEDDSKLTPAERRRQVLREFYRSHIDPVGRIIAEELAKLKEEEKDLKRQMPETLVMEELEKPRQAYVFIRGLYKNRGENVSPGTPAVLPPMAKDLSRNRLGLAKWLVSGQHPLTARVLVNRIWQQYFGLGLVRTAEDFGVRGELPTHPDLLDYLATELVDGGWDLKKLHKRIVLSATYRQAATASKEKLDRDPENRLLSRGPRLRLTAEMIRDNALAVSGLLIEKIGGESVKPVQPRNAWKSVEGFGGGYRRDRDEKQYRRALYVYWKRGSPYPSMLNFDACKRDATTVTRATTTTPLQALTLLNDPAYVECAKMLGQRMVKDREAIGRARDLKKPEEDAKRLVYGFRLCTSRPPTDKETEVLKKLLDDQRAHYKADAAAAKKLLAVGDAKVDEALDAGELAAWATVGNALLNLDATIRR
ncbi:MAG: PSD1 and planctomycete cytochrome C domain-containing protein [Gemmataceae bacterium]